MSFAGMLDESEADELLEIIQKNKGYDDLESRKLYRILPDEKAKGAGCLRVIDESGEDYLYPADCFVIVGAGKYLTRKEIFMISYNKLIEELPAEIRLTMMKIIDQIREEILGSDFKRSDDAVSAPDDNRPESAEAQKKTKPRRGK